METVKGIYTQVPSQQLLMHDVCISEDKRCGHRVARTVRAIFDSLRNPEVKAIPPPALGYDRLWPQQLHWMHEILVTSQGQ